MDRNPYASPVVSSSNGLRRVPLAEVPAEPELGVIDVLEQAAKPPRTWRLAFARDRAWLFVPEEQSAFVLSHADVAEHGTIMPWARFVALVMRGLLPDGRAIAFNVQGEAIDVLKRWLHTERDLHLAKALKKRNRYSLPLGLFIVALNLPFVAGKIDPFSLAFGLGIAALAVVSPRAPRPALFVVEALLWLCLVASNVVAALGGSKLSIVFAILGLLLSRQAYRAYGFYR